MGRRVGKGEGVKGKVKIIFKSLRSRLVIFEYEVRIIKKGRE